jgi:ABC-type multidrug transport system fused ATPase/permease subunit
LKSLRYVFQYARKYTGTFILTVISMLLLVGVQLSAPLRIKTMVATVPDPVAIFNDLGIIIQLAFLTLLVFILRAILQFLHSDAAHVAGWRVVADECSDVYAHFQKLCHLFYEGKLTDQLISRVVNETDLF